MGETFRKLGAWVKDHKALAIALSGGILLLIYLYYSSQQNAANAAAQSAAQAASGQPSDAILSAEIQAQTALQQQQIQAQALATQQGYQAQVDLATIQAQQDASNAQAQAALTLGLAQAGDSTSSILQLLGAQPGTANTTSTIGNTTTNPTTAATVTGATQTAGSGTNAQSNPAPVTALPPPTDPATAAANNPYPGNVDAWGNPVHCPTGMHYAVGACIYDCSQNTVADQWACVQQNDAIWNAPYTSTPSTTQPTQYGSPVNNPPTVSTPVVYQGTTTAATPLPARGAVYQASPPRLSAHSAIGDVATHTVSEADITGTVGGSASIVTHAVYSTPAARANLADLMGWHAVVSPSTVPAAGGPFYNPPQSDVILPGYTVEGGGVMNAIHNSSPTDWASIISGFGVRDAASVQAAIHNMFGVNQPVPLTALGVSEGG